MYFPKRSLTYEQPACRAVPRHRLPYRQTAAVLQRQTCTRTWLRPARGAVSGSADRFERSRRKIEQAVQTALSAAEEQLTAIDWTAYDRVFFLSKSIGTAIAARYAVQHNIHPRQVYYTPIEQALPYLDPTGIAFHGTADPWANTEMITNGCRKIGIPLYLTENANHSMETGDTLHDIFILHDIMDETAHWMDSLA